MHNKEKNMKPIPIVFALALAACQPSPGEPGPAVQTVGASGAPFAQYRTFAFGPAEQPRAPYALSARSFEVERRAQPLIARELTKKGYTLSETKGDFVVQMSAGNTEQPVPSPSESEGNGFPTEHINIGELVIDAIDGSSHTQIWHGQADVRINPQQIDDALLQTAVQRLLAGFPTRVSAL
jgi:hypothetical protein